ncbi:hypothetical protein K438DRAFT_1947226 [Mycena galopus ATCC 62051]|nr:hypothetical protein K438DRAFT_1947226 [Mycena galopus ATCC 62051]
MTNVNADVRMQLLAEVQARCSAEESRGSPTSAQGRRRCTVCTARDWIEEQDETEEEKRQGGLGWERELQEKQGRGTTSTAAKEYNGSEGYRRVQTGNNDKRSGAQDRRRDVGFGEENGGFHGEGRKGRGQGK